jgi:XTP/dITP diphosphohydrolase
VPNARARPSTYLASGEIGDRLLALVAEARAAGVDPEHALRDAVRRVAP